MSENRWVEILLSELKMVRIVCCNTVSPCGAVIEIPVEKLRSVKACPMCGNVLHAQRPVEDDPFVQFVENLNDLQNNASAKISFVLPMRE